jgi:tRNA (Thr-GGU) A37 N-methylase
MSLLPALITYRPIGIIRSAFSKPAEAPVQAAGAPGVVELFPEYREGLLDLEGFSHLILLYHFHRSAPAGMVVTPFLDQQPHGVFATRGPA